MGVVAHLHQAIAHLEAGLGLFLGARVLLHHAPVGRDGVRVPAGEVEGGGGHQRGGGSELRIRPALLQLGGRRPRLRVVAPVALRPRDLQLRRVGPGAVGRGRDLVAPGLDGAAHVSEPQVEIAQALARLERLWRRGVPLDQLSVLLRGAPRFVQVQGAEIAGELQGAAAHVVGAIAAIFAELEEDRARLDQGGVVVTRERQVARLLQLGGRAPAACAEQQGGDDSRPDGSSRHQEKRVPASRGRRNE